eukprot:sb/3461263/
MSGEGEFDHHPIASSTVVKKRKPEGWTQEQDTTFQENVPPNINSEGESSLSLWKYILPAKPPEMEEDFFMGHGQAFEGAHGPHIFSPPHLEAAAAAGRESGGDDRGPLDPIPGFVITNRNVLIRRHSTEQQETDVLSSEDCRKILSAPASMQIEEGTEDDDIPQPAPPPIEIPHFPSLYLTEGEENFLLDSVTPCMSPELGHKIEKNLGTPVEEETFQDTWILQDEDIDNLGDWELEQMGRTGGDQDNEQLVDRGDDGEDELEATANSAEVEVNVEVEDVLEGDQSTIIASPELEETSDASPEETSCDPDNQELLGNPDFREQFDTTEEQPPPTQKFDTVEEQTSTPHSVISSSEEPQEAVFSGDSEQESEHIGNSIISTIDDTHNTVYVDPSTMVSEVKCGDETALCEAFQSCYLNDKTTNITTEPVAVSPRVSQGSLNTVPFVDPENSITTESLCGNHGDNETLQTTTFLQNEEVTMTEMTDIQSPEVQLTYQNDDDDDDDDNDNDDQLKHSHPNFNDTVSPTHHHHPNFDETMSPPTKQYSYNPAYQHPDFSQTPVRKNHSILERVLNEDKKLSLAPTYTLKSPCAVGIARKFVLKIENMTDFWVQFSVSVDEDTKRVGFTTKDRLIVQPNYVEELPVSLVARQPGLCVGTVQLTANSVISGMLPSQQLSTKITAVAELPVLSVSPSHINYGVQVAAKEASFELTNNSKHELPLKIFLECDDDCLEVFSLSDPGTRYPTAVFSVCLPPGSVSVGHLEFFPCERYTECTGVVKVAVDCPNGAVLSSIPVRGTVGQYKLQIPSNQHSLAFKTSPGQPDSIIVNFRNTGNIATSVTLAVSRPFTVTPGHIPSLVPGEDGTCEVCYFPASTEHLTGDLALSIGNDEVVYKVPITASAVRRHIEKPALLANKSSVHFGGVDLGRQREECLVLQNGHSTSLVCLNLRIVSQTKVFYLVGESYTSSSKVTVLDAKQTSSRLWVDIGPLTSGSRNTGRVTLLNRGCRTAFVYGVVEEQEEEEGVWVNPAAVVIPPKQSLDVFVIQNAQNITSHKVAQLKLYCGDNLARRRFCHALNHLGSSSTSCDLPFDPTHEFLGTDPDTEILLPPENLGENDYIFEQKLFLSSIYQLYLRKRASDTKRCYILLLLLRVPGLAYGKPTRDCRIAISPALEKSPPTPSLRMELPSG